MTAHDRARQHEEKPLIDPGLADAGRAQSREVPPPELDAAIVPAHREVSAGPRDPALAEAREPERWWWPLAAAAVIGAVAFGVLQLIPTERSDVDRVVSDAPRMGPGASTAATATPPYDVAAASRVAKDAPLAVTPTDTKKQVESERLLSSDRGLAESGLYGAVTPPAVTERGQGQSVERPAISGDAPASPPRSPYRDPQSTPPATPSRESARPASDPPATRAASNVESGLPAAAGRDPAGAEDQVGSKELQSTRPSADIAKAREWIERIRAFLRDGREPEAQAELNRFRNAFPDADVRLPRDLQDWAASVRR